MRMESIGYDLRRGECAYIYIYIYMLKILYIYIKNNKGLNTDPCGTPLKTDFHVVFCQSAIFLSSQLCHPRYHELFI